MLRRIKPILCWLLGHKNKCNGYRIVSKEGIAWVIDEYRCVRCGQNENCQTPGKFYFDEDDRR